MFVSLSQQALSCVGLVTVFLVSVFIIRPTESVRKEPCGNEGVISWIKDRFGERCSKKWIKNDFSGLEYQLRTKLYGQHLATRMVVTSIRGHLENDDPPKALSLSFHGWTGIGKTFVSEMIARNLYTNGMQSKFVKRFYGQTDFPDPSFTAEYRRNIREAISSCARACCQCLFIFDEIDKMPPGIFDELKGYFDHYSSVHGVNYRRSIFLFISNIGSNKLAEFLLNVWKEGRSRESLELNEVEPYLKSAVYNTDGGLKYSALIKHNLLGTFVPFLPLERDHVKQCIRDLGGNRRPNEMAVDRVVESIAYFPDDIKLFAKTGCTSVLEKLYQHDEF